jgi:hypothetical protein
MTDSKNGNQDFRHIDCSCLAERPDKRCSGCSARVELDGQKFSSRMLY